MESIEDDEQFAGFTRLHSRPDPHAMNYDGGYVLPPAGDARFAVATCASLPSSVSDGARKMLYELITRPQWPSPDPGILLPMVARDTGLECLVLKDYAKELEGLGMARQTGTLTFLPAGLPKGRICSIRPRVNQSAATGPGPSGPREVSFSGFPILPSAIRGAPNPKYIRRGELPVGDAILATTACAALPYNISDGAKKLLYDLITRRQIGSDRGVSLLSIKRDTGIQLPLLLQYVEELKSIGRAKHSEGNCWSPTNLPAAH